MAQLLSIHASPNGEGSFSNQVAESLLAEYAANHPADEIVRLDLSQATLPEFGAAESDAKMALLSGQGIPEHLQTLWSPIQALIDQFKAADKYVIASPMWNFSVPYRLKHYFDVLIQPGELFEYTADGRRGLVTGKPAVVISARGGRYPEGSPMDHQLPLLEIMLQFVGFTEIHSIIVEPTLGGGPEAAEEAKSQAIQQARELATTL